MIIVSNPSSLATAQKTNKNKKAKKPSVSKTASENPMVDLFKDLPDKFLKIIE
jgi:hypothetical protein